MIRLVAVRLLQLVVVSWVLATLLFVAIRVTGDPASLMLEMDATELQVETLRERLGLNRPLVIQYWDFFSGLLPHTTADGIRILDFGDSFQELRPATDVVLDVLPNTLILGATALLLAIFLSIPLGVLAAVWHDRWLGSAVSVLGLLGQTVPNFVFAILLVLFLSVRFELLPTFGFSGWQSLVMPAVCIAAFPTSRLMRLLRNQMLEDLREDYIRTARAKGLTERVVVMRHAFKNSMAPWVTMLGIDFGHLAAGSVIVEKIFAWPGVGRLLVDSVYFRDLPVILAAVFFIGILVVIGNFAADVFYRILDPRIGRENG